MQFAHYGTGDELVTNGRNLAPDNNRTDFRATAAWEATLKELVDGGLLAARGTSWKIFEVAKRGHDAAKRLAIWNRRSRANAVALNSPPGCHAGSPGPLEVVTAQVAGDVDHLADEIQARYTA